MIAIALDGTVTGMLGTNHLPFLCDSTVDLTEAVAGG